MKDLDEIIYYLEIQVSLRHRWKCSSQPEWQDCISSGQVRRDLTVGGSSKLKSAKHIIQSQTPSKRRMDRDSSLCPSVRPLEELHLRDKRTNGLTPEIEFGAF